MPSPAKRPAGENSQTHPRAPHKKIIQLFEEDPAFSGISGGVDSGK